MDPLVAARLFGALTALVLGAAVPEVHAFAVSPDEAMRRFEEAERLYQEGEHQGAIELLRALLEDNDDPVLWYNLGRAYEGAGEAGPAIDAYERYLEGSPDAPDRDDVRERIARLEPETHDEPPAVVAPAPISAPVPPPRVAERHRARVPLVVPWVVFGVGSAGLVTGGVFGILARRSEEQAADTLSQVDARRTHDTARRRALAANVSFAVGGAVAAAGLTWAIVATITHRKENARVRPHGLGIAGRF